MPFCLDRHVSLHMRSTSYSRQNGTLSERPCLFAHEVNVVFETKCQSGWLKQYPSARWWLGGQPHLCHFGTLARICGNTPRPLHPDVDIESDVFDASAVPMPHAPPGRYIAGDVTQVRHTTCECRAQIVNATAPVGSYPYRNYQQPTTNRPQPSRPQEQPTKDAKDRRRSSTQAQAASVARE